MLLAVFPIICILTTAMFRKQKKRLYTLKHWFLTSQYILQPWAYLLLGTAAKAGLGCPLMGPPCPPGHQSLTHHLIHLYYLPGQVA